jgi:hypothetical protein
MRLWLKLARYRSPETCIALKTWNANWWAIAENIWWTSASPVEKINVFVYAYSWGAGWGFTQLAKQLKKRGIRIRTAVLSDPVYRHWYTLGQWRAFVPYSSISVPNNVDEVFSFVQRQNLPAGHLCEAASDRTRIHLPVELMATHQYMDDASDFHDRVLQIARLHHEIKV